MKNLSWLFYKGYYQGFQHWGNFEKPDEKTKKDITNFFNQKNELFESASISSFKQVVIPDFSKNTNKTFSLRTTYPGLLAGSGYSHGIGTIGEYKIGFYLDHITGLPILPGSSIKGVIRSAFPIIVKDKNTGAYQLSPDSESKEKVKANWIFALLSRMEDANFLTENIQPLEEEIDSAKVDFLNRLILEVFEGVKNLTEDEPEKRFFSIYQRNIFFDAIPVRSGNQNQVIFSNDSITPHPDPLKNPNPLLFLKVLPQVTYRFTFQLHKSSVEKRLSDDNLLKLFQKIILTYGLGAKTNVGYGQLVPA